MEFSLVLSRLTGKKIKIPKSSQLSFIKIQLSVENLRENEM